MLRSHGAVAGYRLLSWLLEPADLMVTKPQVLLPTSSAKAPTRIP